MKNQAFFSSKDKSKKIKMLSAAILLGALRVKKTFSEVLFMGSGQGVLKRKQYN